MIRLFSEEARNFTTLGIGVLSDVTNCVVKEELNGSFELEMEYPITGKLFSEIALRRIVYAKPNVVDPEQAFRIYSISRPLNGLVTINAEHISYDMAGYTVGAFNGHGLQDTLQKIQNGVPSMLNCPFSFYTNKSSDIELSIEHPYNMRSLLAGQDESILQTYGGEYYFNNFVVNVLQRRGQDKGFFIRYRKNMTNVADKISSDGMYSGVYPFYYKKVKETISTSTESYEQVYIVGETPFASDWFSLEEGGKPFVPIQIGQSVQVASNDLYKGKLYAWDGEKYYETPDAEPNITRSVNEEIERVEFVELPEKILFIDQRAPVHKIQTLDLTQNFEEEPPVESLRTAAEAFIQNNKLGEVVQSIDVSFVDLRNSSEELDPEYRELLKVGMGDFVSVRYEELGVGIKLEVIKMEYDVLNDCYDSISLGTLEECLEDNIISVGDSISSLTNDKQYCDITTVNKLIADQVNANYIQACNGQFTEAMIKQLETEKIKCSGIIEAGIFDIDKVVSSLLVTESAEISDTLKAGEVVVKGTIYADSGEIGGCIITKDPETGEGVLEIKDANISGTLTAAKINCADVVTEAKSTVEEIVADKITAEYIEALDITVDSANITGTLTAQQIDCEGVVRAADLEIERMVAEDVQTANLSANQIKSGTISAVDINIGSDAFKVSSDGQLNINNGKFIVTPEGNMTAFDGTFGGNVYNEYGSVLSSSITATQRLEAPGTSVLHDVMSDMLSTEAFEIGHESGKTISLGGATVTRRIERNVEPLFRSLYDGHFTHVFITAQSINGTVPSSVSITAVFDYIQGGESHRARHTGTLPAGSSSVNFSEYRLTGSATVTNVEIEIPRDGIAYFDVEEPGSGFKFDGDLYPFSNKSHNLGAANYYWNNLYIATEHISGSDRKIKKDINYDISNYDGLFQKLKPVSYKFVDGTSGRTHLGLIAQDVEEAIQENAMTSTDYGLLIKSVKEDSEDIPEEERTDADYSYGLRYGELHSLEIYEIQKLQKTIQRLEERIAQLEAMNKHE